jgi:hypothetical protein
MEYAIDSPKSLSHSQLHSLPTPLPAWFLILIPVLTFASYLASQK